MAQVIKATVGMADATGFGTQRRLFWCKNTSQWLLLVVLGSDLTKLRVYYSTSAGFAAGTWSECSGSPYTFNPDGGYATAPLSQSSGSHYSGCYRDIGGHDIVYVGYLFDPGGAAHAPAILRFEATAPGVVNFTNDTQYVNGGTWSAAGSPSYCVVTDLKFSLVSQFGFRPHLMYGDSGFNVSINTWASADTGTSWGIGAEQSIAALSEAGPVNNVSMSPCGTVLSCEWENPGFADPNSLSGVRTCNTGSTLGANAGFATIFTGLNPNNFSAVSVWPEAFQLVSGTNFSEMHCVLRTGANTWEHRRNFSPNSNTWTAGASIPVQTSKDGEGPVLVTNGVDLYLFAIDSDAANTVRYIKYTRSSNTWAASWTALETSTKVRTKLTANHYQQGLGNCHVAWTEVNGANWDIAYNSLNINPSHPLPLVPTLSYHQQYKHARS